MSNYALDLYLQIYQIKSREIYYPAGCPKKGGQLNSKDKELHPQDSVQGYWGGPGEEYTCRTWRPIVKASVLS